MLNLFTIIFFILLPFTILGYVHWGWTVAALVMHFVGSWAIKANAKNEQKQFEKEFRQRYGNWD